mgnify:CR=1 FL=1
MSLKFLKNKKIKKRFFYFYRFFILISVLIILFESLFNINENKEKIVNKFKNKITKKIEKKEGKTSNEIWAAKVQEGGYILHFRHTQREKWNDAPGFDAYALSQNLDVKNSTFKKATCLTPQGIEEAKLIKNIFDILDVKISYVISSPSCRALMTAEIAFGKIDQISNSLVYRSMLKPQQRKIMANHLKKIVLNLKISMGKNIILSGHGFQLESWADGKKFLDENNAGSLDRNEGGFVVIEKIGEKLVVQHTFKTFSNFINSLIEIPVN